MHRSSRCDVWVSRSVCVHVDGATFYSSNSMNGSLRFETILAFAGEQPRDGNAPCPSVAFLLIVSFVGSKENKMTKGTNKRKSGTIRLIGIFRLLKGILLLALGFGALKLLHRNVADEIQKWLQNWPVDPENHYFGMIVSTMING